MAPEASAPARRTTYMLAEFERARDVLHAAEAVKNGGYTRWDVHTPFPIHGMDRAMGLRDSKLGLFVIVAALTGLSCAFAMMYWMGKVDYPYIVGGKSPGALPSMLPIMFELTILFSAFGTVGGMLYLNGLPRHHHELFESDRFKAASDDKFFISVSTDDPRFEAGRTRALLESQHATSVELLVEGL